MLIWVTAIVSVVSPVLTYFLMHFLKIKGPLQWFALSLSGIKQGFLWQPLSYFFLNSYSTGLSLSLFISLFFLMMILWFAGSEVQFRFGNRSFFLLYFSSGVFAGIVSLLLLTLFSSSQVIVGSGPPIYALLMIFAMLYPNLELFFFFFLRVKAKWLVAVVFGLVFLISLSSGQFIYLAASLSAIVWAYFIGRLFWKLPNPFPFTRNFSKKKKKHPNKIIDISVFQEDDNAFMDRMLYKIAKYGESSLTKKEKEKMQKISRKKR